MGIAEIIWTIAVLLGIIAIFSIAPFNIALNAIITSLAILALVWIHIARKSLSKGSSLRKFAYYIFLCLIFMFLYSIWGMAEQILNSEFYLKYLWFALGYLFLIVSCYKLMKIGTEFGFSIEAGSIKKLLKKKAGKR